MKEKTITKISLLNSAVRGLHMMTIFFLGIHFSNLGLSGAQIGLLFFINTITSILTVIPSGFSNDTFRSKRLITFSLLLVAIEYLGFALTDNFSVLAILFFLGGIGTTFYNTSIQSLFHKESKKKSISKKIGIFQSLNYLALALGMITSGTLLQNSVSFENIFLIVGVGFLFMTVASSSLLPKNETTELELLRYKKDILRPKVLFFLLIMFLFAQHFGAEVTSYGLFLKENLQLAPIQIGLFMGSAILFMALTAHLLANKRKRLAIKIVLLTGLLLSGSGHILMTFGNEWFSFAMRSMHEIGDSMVFFVLFYGISQLFDLKRVGGNLGIFEFTMTMGSAVGALVYGPMGAASGYNFPLLVSGIAIICAGIITIPFMHLIDHK